MKNGGAEPTIIYMHAHRARLAGGEGAFGKEGTREGEGGFEGRDGRELGGRWSEREWREE
jgi:hypothetical protein